MIHNRHTKMKVILVMISEFLGFQLTPLAHYFGIHVESSAITSFVVGSILAVLTIGAYEYIIMRNTVKLQRELSSVLNHMLYRYDSQFGKDEKQKGGK